MTTGTEHPSVERAEESRQPEGSSETRLELSVEGERAQLKEQIS